jgi:hypothetical protein
MRPKTDTTPKEALGVAIWFLSGWAISACFIMHVHVALWERGMLVLIDGGIMGPFALALWWMP